MHGDDQPPSSSRPLEIASTAGADRNLLFGIIALQVNFISREQLVAAFDSWVQDKSRTLAEILERQGALPTAQREVMEKLVGMFVEKHGGDAERSLAAFSSVAEVRLDLERLNDPDLTATLTCVGQGGPPDPRLATTLAPASGTSLGRFRILRPHAKGGLGQVSVALDQDLNREVALKEIQPQHADDVIARERFVVEAEITGGLEHPGIVPVYALGQSPDGRPFYAMRFVKGDSLKQAIEIFHKPDNSNRKDPGARHLALRQLLGRFIDVCNAMEYAHSRGVLHRDLKPGNIMVGKYGETLVVDWGLAKSVGKKEVISDEGTLRPASALSSSGQTQPGSAIGTPAYMSPEQAAGKLDELGPASDVYSLGATLYQLLCGKPPFEKDDVSDILQKVQRGDFQKPRSVASEVPTALEAICLTAMALKSADRYQMSRALADDLEHWLADEPVVAAPDTLGERLSRFGRKHKGYVRAGAVAVVLMAIVSLAAAFLINEQRREKGQLADKNAGLFVSERDAKTKAEKLAARNEVLANAQKKLAQDERTARVREERARLATERQLRIATAERLAAMSYTKLSESPEVRLLLAVESGRATRHDEEGLSASSHQVLLDALAGIGGRPLVGHKASISNVAISPDSRWIVTAGGEDTARIWDLTAVNPAAKPRILTGHNGHIRSVAISSDSRWIVTGSTDMTARVWDLTAEDPAANPRVLRGHQSFVTSVTFSPNSRWVVTASNDNTARIWDFTAENPAANARVLSGHELSIDSVAVSPDSRWIVTWGLGKTARVWDLTIEDPAANPRVLNGHQGPIYSLAISPDSRWIVTTSSDNTARVSDLTAADRAANPRDLPGHKGLVNHVVISADGRWIVTGSYDKTARVWGLTAENPGANPRVLSGHQEKIISVAISPNNRWVVTASWDKTARVWDLMAEDPAANPRVLNGHQGAIYSLAISPDSRWIVTGSEDQTARIWDLTDESPAANPRVLPGHESWIDRIEVTPDSRRIVTVSPDKTARVWDLFAENSTGHSLVLSGHQDYIYCVAISPDSRWIVTGSKDTTARIWDLMAENPARNPRVLSGHQGEIWSVAIGPDSRQIVTVSNDKTARVWDLMAEDPAANPRVLSLDQGPVLIAAISPDCRRIVTASNDNTARVWDLMAKDPANNPRVLTGHPTTHRSRRDQP